MLLSIVMMVKNEEENLKRTLPSLNTLREQIDSELIILDTGSTDDTILAAKQYTEKVFSSPWNNDFASMRNKSFEYAEGEWLLVLDADEELYEFDNLIDFFNSNKSNEYNSATISLKNFLNEELTSFTFSTLPRMFKRKDFKYEGAIHEQPMFKKPIYNPEGGIAAFNHYGYIFQDEEFRFNKMKRNESILLSELEKKPNDPYILFQLGVNFSILGNFDEARIYLEKSINLYQKMGILYYPAYASLIELLFTTQKYKQCKDICLRYLKKEKHNFDIHYKLAELYQIESNFTESIKHYERYLFFIKNYHLSAQAKDISCVAKTQGNEFLALINLTKIYFALEDYEKCLDYYNLLSKSYPEKTPECYKHLIESLHKLNKYEEIINSFLSIDSNINKSKFLYVIESLFYKLKDDEKKVLYHLFSEIDESYGKLSYMRLRNKIDFKTANELLKKENDGYFGDLLNIALKNGIDIFDLLKDIPLYKVNILIGYLFEFQKSSINDLFEYILSSKVSLNIKKNAIYSIICEHLIQTSKISKTKKELIFPILIQTRFFYLDNFINNDLEIVSSELISKSTDYFVIELSKAKRELKSNPLELSRKLNSLSKIFPTFSEYLLSEIDLIKKEFSESSSFKKLEQEYISVIMNEINNNNLNSAIVLIEELEKINNKKIPQVITLKSIIEIQNNNYENAHKLIKESFILNSLDLDLIFNLGQLYLLENNPSEALNCFKYISKNTNDEELLNDTIENINLLKEALQC